MNLLSPREVVERHLPRRSDGRPVVAEKTLELWRRTGRGPRFVRLGGRIYYRAEDVDAFVEQGLQAPPDGANAA